MRCLESRTFLGYMYYMRFHHNKVTNMFNKLDHMEQTGSVLCAKNTAWIFKQFSKLKKFWIYTLTKKQSSKVCSFLFHLPLQKKLWHSACSRHSLPFSGGWGWACGGLASREHICQPYHVSKKPQRESKPCFLLPFSFSILLKKDKCTPFIVSQQHSPLCKNVFALNVINTTTITFLINHCTGSSNCVIVTSDKQSHFGFRRFGALLF